MMCCFVEGMIAIQSPIQSVTRFTQSTTQSVTAKPEQAIIELIRQESSIKSREKHESQTNKVKHRNIS